MNRSVLFVDDEEQILDGMRRNLRKYFDVTTAPGPEAGIEIIKNRKETFAVIVSDMRMPGMNGIQFLSQAKSLSPDSVKLMLTGNADQETAVAAVNTGEVFKFLNKPCEQETLEKVIEMAIRQYQLVIAERELLTLTVKGSIESLAEILALVRPAAFGRVSRLRSLCERICSQIDFGDSWELDSAVSLSQVGCLNVNPDILDKVVAGKELNTCDEKEYFTHPAMGAKLIQKIPRLEKVAKIISYQYKNFDGSGFPRDLCKGQDIPLEARILRLVLAFDEIVNAGWSEASAVEELKKVNYKFDPALLKALDGIVDSFEQARTVKVSIEALSEGMVIAEDVVNDNGILIISRGIEVNETIKNHLVNFKKTQNTLNQVLVNLPVEECETATTFPAV